MKKKKQKKSKGAKKLLAVLIVLIIFCSALAGCLWYGGWIDMPDTSEYAGTENGWNLILVNNELRIPENLEVELMELTNGQQIDRRIYPDLQQMFDDMRAKDIYPDVVSGYRTAGYQQGLMDEEITNQLNNGFSRRNAKARAEQWVAKVGHSEHQTGLAVDIGADSRYSTAWDVYSWLMSNSWRYGFIYRYPEDKTEITGINCEPWHYRYVGKEAAAVMYEKNICLEEYIEINGIAPAA